MNTTWKRYLSVLCAVALVLVLGKFSSDRYLMATDGGNDLVADASGDAVGADENSFVSEEVILSLDGIVDVEETSKEEVTDADAAESEETEAEIEEVRTDDLEEELLEEEAEEEEVEEEESNREILVSCNYSASENVEEGTTIVLSATLIGYDELSYTLQWQRSLDGQSWEDVAGANQLSYSFPITMENEEYVWRLAVNVAE